MQDFERFFQITGGLMARGPKKLLIRYASLLEVAGLEWSIAGEHPSTDWDRSGRRKGEDALKIFLMGQTDTYIIADDFQFTAL